MSQSQRIFMTGGSGYIGSVIIEYAIAQGYTVHSLSRSESSDAKIKALGAVPIRGDLETYDVLTREAAAADIVFTLADILSSNYGKMTLEDRARMNNAALDAIAEGLQGKNKPLVISSGSAIVRPDPEGGETTEAAPMREQHGFGLSESHVLSFKDKGIRVSAIRLAPYVYGRGGSGVKLFMGRFAQTGDAFYVGEGAAKTTTVHVDDAARMYLLAAQKSKGGEVYNASFETHVTQRQLAEAMAAALKLDVRSLPLADAEEKFGKFFALFLTLENRASHEKAKSELGWEPEAKKGILEEIASGSYVEVAEALRKPAA